MADGGFNQEAAISNNRIEDGYLRQNFEVDGSKVELTFTEAKPKNKENIDPKKVVISIAPWAWGAEMPIISGGGQKIADGFGENAYTISTRTDQIGPDALLTEVKGIAEFIKANQFREVTIVGHSEGGIKAVELATVLEQISPQININGVLLLDPMGMNQDSILSLGKNFTLDIFKFTPAEFKRANKLPPEGGTLQFLLSLWQDMKAYGLRYPKALYHETKAMATANSELGQIKSPLIIMTGERDFVSDYRKYLPTDKVEAQAKPALPDDKLREWIINSQKWEHLPIEEQTKFASQEEFITRYIKMYRTQEEMVRLGKARNEILKEKITPAAENTAILIASRIGTSHTGLPDNRFESVIKIASKTFPRWQRQKAAAQIDLARK